MYHTIENTRLVSHQLLRSIFVWLFELRRLASIMLNMKGIVSVMSVFMALLSVDLLLSKSDLFLKKRHYLKYFFFIVILRLSLPDQFQLILDSRWRSTARPNSRYEYCK